MFAIGHTLLSLEQLLQRKEDWATTTVRLAREIRMPLLNTQVRTELQNVANAIKTAGNLVSNVPEIQDLHDTLFEDIPSWKKNLHARLRSVVNAIDGGQRPELQRIPGLRAACIAAQQSLGPPGGSPPGVGDNVDP